MNAIELLKNDHKKVRALLSELESTTNRAAKKRVQLLATIAMELEVHTTIEEEIFYPAFKEAGDKSEDGKLYFEALEEHRAAGDLVLPDLQATSPTSDQFGGRAKVLKELIEHHAEEEEKEMFPRARKLLDAATLRELGAAMEERKLQLMAKASPKSKAKAGKSTLLDAVASAFAPTDAESNRGLSLDGTESMPAPAARRKSAASRANGSRNASNGRGR